MYQLGREYFFSNCSFFYPNSVVRMFAQHKDDKKKIEKALEAAHLPHGRVTKFLFFLFTFKLETDTPQ